MYNDTRMIGPDTDIEEFLTTLKMPWKTMDTDMDTALGIITNHAKTEIDTAQLLTVTPLNNGNASIEFPEWQADVEKTLINQYGLIEGKLIFNKVLMRLFQMSNGTEQPLH